jgi:hypothetical protein
MSLEEAWSKAAGGMISDAKTLAVLLRAKYLLEED